jgi:hypothetical protein
MRASRSLPAGVAAGAGSAVRARPSASGAKRTVLQRGIIVLRIQKKQPLAHDARRARKTERV